MIFKTPLLNLFGASPDTLPYADSYLEIYLIGTISVQIALGMNQFVSAQGFAKTAMLTVCIGAALIIGANYLNLQAGRRASRKDAIQDGVQGHPGQKEPAHGAVR